MWDPETWELTPVREIHAQRFQSLDALADQLSSLYDIPKENLAATKIISVWNFFRVQLQYGKFEELSGRPSYLAEHPFYLSTDGLLFVIRDKSKSARELTPLEVKEFGFDEYQEAIVQNGAMKGTALPVKEKALKITVKKKKRRMLNPNFGKGGGDLL